MRIVLSIFAVLLLVSACGSQPKELKSPCVGLEGSPCGPRRPANADLFQV